ncbi:hypothetical protein Cgig2_018728 [Carnegiea gigantea]|uniref:Uncharacterized protein n=1 Tax=Carnegiea gigantea TaxID=171969 RepID=A0A9Q1GK30_9CARY|nr:hypothetical protein Cgig2_018728 [Carnegiea gigantea]
MMEEEGRRTTPSSAAHAPPLHSGSDGIGQVLNIVYISTLEHDLYLLSWYQGFGNIMEEEGHWTTPSSAAHAVHAPPLPSRSDGIGQVLSIVYVSTLEHGLHLLSWDFDVFVCMRCLHHKIVESALNAVVILVGLGFFKSGEMLSVKDKGGLISGFWF